jgi:hypothetical protein
MTYTQKHILRPSERNLNDISLVEILYEEFSITSKEINGVIELDEGFTMPSEQEIKEASDRYLYKIKTSKYKEERFLRYPPLVEQLDMLYHDISNGNLNNGTWIETIKSIKEQFPKPNS